MRRATSREAQKKVSEARTRLAGIFTTASAAKEIEVLLFCRNENYAEPLKIEPFFQSKFVVNSAQVRLQHAAEHDFPLNETREHNVLRQILLNADWTSGKADCSSFG